MFASEEFMFGGLLGGDYGVAPGVEIRVFCLAFGVREQVVEAQAGADGEGGRADEVGDGALYLGVVEDDGVGLVAEEGATQVVLTANGCEEVGADVVGPELYAEDAGRGFVDLVPRQALVRRDLEGLAYGVAVAHHAHEGLGEVAAVGEGPEARAVAGDDDRLALEHALHHLP